MQPLLKSLPIVARAMGENYGVQVTIGGNTAYTNGEIINIPVLPEDDKMAEIYARGYLDHEAGHVRYTDFQIQGNTDLENWLANVFEDIRIEKAMGRKYPGCKINLERMSEAIASEGGFSPGAESPIPSLAGFFILTLARNDILRQKALKDVATENEKLLREKLPEKTVNRLKGLVWKCDSLTSSKDSLNLARKVLEEIQDEIDNLPEQPPEPSPSEQDNQDDSQEENEDQLQASGEGDSSEDSDDSQDSGSGSGESEDEADQDGQGSGSSGAGQDPNGQNSEGDSSEGDNDDSGDGEKDPNQSGENQAGGQDQNPPSDQGDSESKGKTGGDALADPQAVKEALKQILDAGSDDLPQDLGKLLEAKLGENSNDQGEYHDPGAIRIPSESRADSHRGVAPKMEDVKRETAALRARLQGLVQASRLQRSFPKRTGFRVDGRSLSRIAVGDDRIYQSKREKTAVNTAVVILLDRSGSMAGNEIEVAKKAVLASASALDVIPGVAVSTALFPGTNSEVAPITRFGQKVKAESYGISASGGTPLAPALWWAAATLLSRPEPRKIILVATDGEPNNCAAVHAAVKRMSAAGIELLGLGICTTAVEKYFQTQSSITKIEELPKALFGMLQKKLTEKAA